MVQAASGGTASVSIPLGGRLLWVQGEADGKPTYDFTVRVATYSGGLHSTSTRYVDTRNGARVNLFQDFPQISTATIAPSALGDMQIVVEAGSGCNIQIFYNADVLDPQ